MDRLWTTRPGGELRWLWRDRYGQLAILTLVTGLMWLTGWGTPYLMLLAVTRRRLGLDYSSASTPASRQIRRTVSRV